MNRYVLEGDNTVLCLGVPILTVKSKFLNKIIALKINLSNASSNASLPTVSFS